MTTLEELQGWALNAYSEQLGVPAEECVDGLMEFILLELQDTYDPEDPVEAAVQALEAVRDDVDAMIEDIKKHAGKTEMPQWLREVVQATMTRLNSVNQ